MLPFEQPPDASEGDLQRWPQACGNACMDDVDKEHSLDVLVQGTEDRHVYRLPDQITSTNWQVCRAPNSKDFAAWLNSSWCQTLGAKHDMTRYDGR